MNSENPAMGGAGGVTSPKAPKIFLIHPLTNDEVEVDATPAAMVPYMVQGYVQKKGGV